MQHMVTSNGRWGVIIIDLIANLPICRRQHNYILVIVCRMTISSNFILLKKTHSIEDYSKLYHQEAVKLHGVTISIIYNICCNLLQSF